MILHNLSRLLVLMFHTYASLAGCVRGLDIVVPDCLRIFSNQSSFNNTVAAAVSWKRYFRLIVAIFIEIIHCSLVRI